MFLLAHFKLVLVRLDMSPKYMSYSGLYYVWHFVCLRIHKSCLFYSLKTILSDWVTSNEHPQRHIFPRLLHAFVLRCQIHVLLGSVY